MSDSVETNELPNDIQIENQEETETPPSYPREEELMQLLQKVFSVMQINGYANHPIVMGIITHEVLKRNGYDPEFRVGYLWRPDAPQHAIRYGWVETRVVDEDGRAGDPDVTDMVAFPDNSKHIMILGQGIGLGPESFKCKYLRRLPSGQGSWFDGTVSRIREGKDGTPLYDIVYEDGERFDYLLPASYLRPRESTEGESLEDIAIGSLVSAKYVGPHLAEQEGITASNIRKSFEHSQSYLQNCSERCQNVFTNIMEHAKLE